MYCTHMNCIALFLPAGCISACAELGGVVALRLVPCVVGVSTDGSVNTNGGQTEELADVHLAVGVCNSEGFALPAVVWRV